MQNLTHFFQLLTVAYVQQVIRFKYAVLFLSVALTATLGYFAKDLQNRPDIRYFFAEENAELMALNDHDDTFSSQDSVVLAFQPRHTSIATGEVLKLTHEITDALWDMPHAARVDSITNYQYTRADGDDIYISDLLEYPEALTDEIAQELVKIAESRPEISTRLVSLPNNTLAINTRTILTAESESLRSEAMDYAFALVDELRAAHPDIEFALSGMIVRTHYFATAPGEDLSLLIPIMFALLSVALWALTRSFVAPVITLILVGLSGAAALGTGALSGIPINSISSAAPIIVLTVAVADAIHVLISYLMLRDEGMEARSAVEKSLVINAQPILLTTATTAIGFLSLNFSVSPPYQDLGNFAAFGAIYAWILSMTFLPAALAIAPPKSNPSISKQIDLIKGASGFFIEKRKPMFAAVCLLGLGSLILMPRLEFNDDFAGYFEEDHPSTTEMHFFMDRLNGMFFIDLIIPGGDTDSVTDPQYLAELQRFTAWLETQPEITHVDSVLPIFKNLNRAMNGDNESFYRLMDSKELNSQYLLLYELSLPYGMDLNDRIDLDKSKTRVTIATERLKTKEFDVLARRIKNWMSENLPSQMESVPTGQSLLFSRVGIDNFESLKPGTIVAFIGIAICIGVALGSFKLGVISLILNVLPFIIVFGLFSLSGQYLAAWTPFVIPTALGLVVDATVHLLSKYNFARSDKQLDALASIHYSFTHVGMALWVSTIVLVLGFSTLYFSIVTTLNFLGIGTALILLAALLIDIMALPAMIMLAQKKSDSSEGHL